MAPELDDAYWRLVLDNRWLVKWTIKRMRIRGLTKGRLWDDLVQAGTLGLCEAARAYESGRGVKFSNLAIPMIRQALIREIRLSTTIILPHWHLRHDARTGSSDELKARGERVAEALPIEAAASTPDPDSGEDEESPAFRESREELWRQIAELPPDSRAAMELHIRGLTSVEIGQELGIRPKAAEGRYRRAIERIRRKIAK